MSDIYTHLIAGALGAALWSLLAILFGSFWDTLRNWWAARSRISAAKRIKKLEDELIAIAYYEKNTSEYFGKLIYSGIHLCMGAALALMCTVGLFALLIVQDVERLFRALDPEIVNRYNANAGCFLWVLCDSNVKTPLMVVMYSLLAGLVFFTLGLYFARFRRMRSLKGWRRAAQKEIEVLQSHLGVST
jgi:hypothetical protein